MKPTEGFQKPRSAPNKEVRLAVMTYNPDGSVRCSCGWGYRHVREKVREDAIDRHFVRKHAGRGIRI